MPPRFGTGMGLVRGGGGGAGSLTPAPPYSWESAFGGIPQVPSPGASQGAAMGSNLGNLGSIYNLTGGLNTAAQNQMIQNLTRGLPNYQGLISQSSTNIGQKLQGQLPGDVIDQLLQGAAERGIMTGTIGSDNQNAAYLRALGLNSLDMMNQGEKDLTGAIARTPQAQQVDPTKYLLTPQDWQAAQMAANLYKSAPVPGDAARWAANQARSGLRAGMGAGGGGASINTAGLGRGSPWGSAWEERSAGIGPSQSFGALGPFDNSQTDPWSAWSSWAEGIPTGGGSSGAQTTLPGGNWFSNPFDFSGWMSQTPGYYGSEFLQPSDEGGGYYYAGENYGAEGYYE